MAVGKKKSTQKKISKRISKKTEKKPSQKLLVKNQSPPSEDRNRLPELRSFNKIPDEVKNEVEEGVVTNKKIIQAAFSKGPIPSAKEMKGYQEVDSSFPERIIKEYEKDSEYRRQMYEKDSEHRRQMQEKLTDGQVKLMDNHIVIENKNVTTKRLDLILVPIVILIVMVPVVVIGIIYSSGDFPWSSIIPSSVVVIGFFIYKKISDILKWLKKPRD